jgi:hypothetical protein
LVRDLRLIKRHLNLGGNVVICSEEMSTESATISVNAQGFGRDTRVRVIEIGDEPREALQRLGRNVAEHDPGPPAKVLVMNGDDPGEDALLLARSFHDFEEINLTRLLGGGAKVFRVDAANQDQEYEPFIVKFDAREKIQRELDNYRQFVERYVAFPHRAPLIFDRRVDGHERGALVSWFVSDSRRLDVRLQHANPNQVVAALFSGPLRTWRQIRRGGEASLGEVYRESGRLFRPDDARLFSAYRGAQVMDGQSRAPGRIHR